jgi:hypothetical protein
VGLERPCRVSLRARFLARILVCFLLCMFFLALVFGISSPISICSTYSHPTPLENRAPGQSRPTVSEELGRLPVNGQRHNNDPRFKTRTNLLRMGQLIPL